MNQMASAAWYQGIAADRQQAMTIGTQIAATARKHEAERWKLQQDTATKVFELQQEAIVFKAKAQDKMGRKWDEYIRG